MSHPFLRSWIEKAAAQGGLGVRRAPLDKARMIEELVLEYTGGEGTFSEALPNGVQLEDAWKRLCESLPRVKLLMFFEPRDSSDVWEVGGPEVLSALLSETPGFVFFVTDFAISFVAGVNDHSYVVGDERFAGFFPFAE